MKRICTLLAFSVVSLAFAFAALAQDQTKGTTKQTVVKTPIKQTSSASGEEMYLSYCAACHGNHGKGDGPAAAAMKQPPADLTVLAKNNGGTFPSSHVVQVLNFGVEAPAHGSKDMPIWRDLLKSLHGNDMRLKDALVQTRIANLTDYIKTLQAK